MVGDTKSILVYSPSWLGDAVMSLAALRSLRAYYPDARITVLARSWVVDLYKACEAVDDTLEYDHRGIHKGPLGFLRLVALLREPKFDLALLFPNAFRAAAVVWAARIPKRLGYGTDGRTSFLTRAAPPAPRPFGRHQVYYYLDLLRDLGIPTAAPDNRLHLTTELRGKAQDLLTRNGWNGRQPLVGIHPGATGSSAKRWFPARYAEVGDRLADLLEGRVILLGGPREQALTEEILDSMRTSPIDLSGQTSLEELMGVLDTFAVFVTNDSGPMHIAAALGTPTVAVFGPTDERETGPIGQGSGTVRKEVHCSPCLLKECPTDYRCMLEVEVDDVVQRATELLGKKTKSGPREAVS